MQDVNLRGTVGRLAACAAALAITGLTTSAMAQTGGSGGMNAKQWTGPGSNGHWYALVQNGKAWDIARKYASDNGGHLVSITSQDEQNWIVANILSRVSPEAKVWIGARAPNGSCTTPSAYYWTTSEAFSYQAFITGEPSNAGECALAMRRTATASLNGRWESQALTAILRSIVEWEADCNEDGFVDYGQIALGYLVDNNQNYIPDCCELGVDCCPDGRLPDQDGCGGGTVFGDCNANGRCDSTETDCNNNGKPDDCDIACGVASDCNTNGIPDSCDIAGPSEDCNRNGVPDECECCDSEPDGILDECEPDPLVVLEEEQGEGCAGDFIYYKVKVINPPFRLVAGQFNIEYDTSLLQLVDVLPGVNPNYVFGIPFELHDPASGDLLWYSALPPGSAGVFPDSIVARLQFRAIGNNCPLDPKAKEVEVRWQTGTRCTLTGIATSGGTLNVNVPTQNPGHVVIDGQAPVFVTPPVERIEVQADAGIPCQAQVTIPFLPVATDNCGNVTITPVRSDGKPLTDPFNCGTTFIGWNAVDECGNKTTRTTEVVVNPWNVVLVQLEWDRSKRNAQGACQDADFGGSVIRCVEFTFSTGTGPSGQCYSTEKEFTFVNGVAVGQVLVPGAAGMWTQASADDDLHSLVTTSAVSDIGREYSVSFSGADAMLLGDFNDDNCIDAADYAIWTSRFNIQVPVNTGCSYVPPPSLGYHPDISGNGLVDQADADRLLCNAATCGDSLEGNCGSGGGLAWGSGPIMALDVATMSALIGADASSADINGDGIIDAVDMGLVAPAVEATPVTNRRK
ncbi:MAG: hypothetical protein RL461_1364 [Planctomycetota bacterium]|jgi:hypothetical protein